MPPVTAVVDSNFVFLGLTVLGEEVTTAYGYAWAHMWKEVWRLVKDFGVLRAQGLTGHITYRDWYGNKLADQATKSAAAHGRLELSGRRRLVQAKKMLEGVAVPKLECRLRGDPGKSWCSVCLWTERRGERPGSIDVPVLELVPQKECELKREAPRLACLVCGATGAARASSFAGPRGEPGKAGKAALSRLAKRPSPGAVKTAVKLRPLEGG
ncbi:unnamed protein product [Prorocentrum cordatum]|uniref:Uncharacterized protein n=1 Tax=Prorocentrum cordatum TaxID=2364126 RepID=A0ABN9WA24_9DINO|nr:unnamed protein product [Polarella glacialis]